MAERAKLAYEGIKCPNCNAQVPNFEGVTTEEEMELKALINNGHFVEAAKSLSKISGFDMSVAKVWFNHKLPLHNIDALECPFCGEPRRTALAKQCPSCLATWHFDQ